MARWYKIAINANQIVASTFKAGLIELDEDSKEYQGFRLWVPRKLIRQNGGAVKAYTFSFTTEFKFKAFKINKKGVKTAQREIEAKELLKAHGIEIEEAKETEKEAKETKETQTELNFENKKTA